MTWLALLALVTMSPPAPVRAYAARLEQCEHWAGEEAYDAGRGRQIARAQTRLRCDKLERDRGRLVRRFPDPRWRGALRAPDWL